MIVQPLKDLFLKSNTTHSRKIMCLSAIDVIMSEEPAAQNLILVKEVIDQITNLVSEIVSKYEFGQNKDFGIIAKMLAKLNANSEGEKLINEMKLSYGAFMKLRGEMKKFEFNPDHTQFTFDSGLSSMCSSSIKVKSEFH